MAKQIQNRNDLPAVELRKKEDLTTDACIELLLAGYNNRQIADCYGVKYQSIEQRLNRVGIKRNSVNLQALDAFKKNRADIYLQDQLRYRAHITDKKLSNTSAAQLKLMECQSIDKERLERGEHTDNIRIESLNLDLTELVKRNQVARDNCIIVDD